MTTVHIVINGHLSFQDSLPPRRSHSAAVSGANDCGEGLFAAEPFAARLRDAADAVSAAVTAMKH
ncbi:MAG: hypothetical protein WAT78_12145, partial [Rhizobiaceae bacterium]